MAICGTFQLKQIYSRTLTVDHTQVPSTQTDFPVLVRLSNPTFKHVLNGGRVQNVSGFDIQFFSDAALTTKLKWEMERYNRSTGEVVAWVKIASVSSASDTVFYMSYGDPSIVTDQSDAVNTFSNSFHNVYHLKDGTTLNLTDVIANNNGTNHGATAAGGPIDGAAWFLSTSSQYVDCGLMTSLQTELTISAWVNAVSFPNPNNAVGGYIGATGNSMGLLEVKSTGKLSCFAGVAAAFVSYDGTGSNTLVAGTTYYLAVTYNSSAGLIGYVNASQDGTAAANGALNISGGPTFYIGQEFRTAGRFWNGMIDEFRICSLARSANWITCEYNNQQTGSTFVTLGAET